MTSEHVRVEGLGALVRELKRAGESIDDLKEANQAAGRIVLDAAEARVPRRTGRLAASGRVNRAAKKAEVRFGSARVPYAAPIHWGWAKRHIKPHPFVTDAAEATQPAWLAEYERELQKVLNKVGGA